jgi:hypothetical protein
MIHSPVFSAVYTTVHSSALGHFPLNSFYIASLFANGEQGAWYDPSDLTTLFQDSNGTTPVTADGQPVGLMLDKSKGLALGTELVTGVTKSALAGWVDNGDGSFTASNTSNYFTVECPMVAGTIYQYSYTVVEYTSGKLRIGLDAAYTAYRTPSVGEVFVGYFKDGSGSADDYLIWGQNFIGKVSGLSVKELKGNHATQTVSASRPTYKTDGTLHWLAFDGVDDSIGVSQNVLTTSDVYWGINRVGNGKTLLLSEAGFGSSYLAVAADNTSSSPDSSSGSPTYKADGVELLRTRQALYDAVTQTASLVIEANDVVADSSWDKGVNFGGYTAFEFTGNLYSLIISETTIDSTRSSVRQYAAGKSGVTL